MILTTNRPVDIIGKENMNLFTKHMQICFSSVNGGEFPEKRLNKEIGAADREQISKVLRILRENGYIPFGIKENGTVRWRMISKSDQQTLFEERLKEYQELPIEELQRIGRSGYLETVKNVEVEQVKDHEILREKIEFPWEE